MLYGSIREVIFHFAIALSCILFYFSTFHWKLENRELILLSIKVVSLVYFHVFPSSVAMTASAESHQTGMAVKLSNLLELLATSRASMHL